MGKMLSPKIPKSEPVTPPPAEVEEVDTDIKNIQSNAAPQEALFEAEERLAEARKRAGRASLVIPLIPSARRSAGTQV